MRTYDNGCGFTVTFSVNDVHRFASRWPCCDLTARRGFFEFDNYGDLVDLDGNQPDRYELLAFSRACQEHGERRINVQRTRGVRQSGPVVKT